MDGRRARIVLGVGNDAGPAEIRRAFRARALVTHPDHGGNASSFAEIVDALAALDDVVAPPVFAVRERPAPVSIATRTAVRRVRLAPPSGAPPDVRRHVAGGDGAPRLSSVHGRGALGTRARVRRCDTRSRRTPTPPTMVASTTSPRCSRPTACSRSRESAARPHRAATRSSDSSAASAATS